MLDAEHQAEFDEAIATCKNRQATAGELRAALGKAIRSVRYLNAIMAFKEAPPDGRGMFIHMTPRND